MHLYVAVFGDEFEAVEIRAHLRDVVDNGCDAKDCWVSAVVLHTRNCQQIQIPRQLQLQRCIQKCLFWRLIYFRKS